MQNYLTNMTMNMTEVKSGWGPMGKVHKGFWKAMGDPPIKRRYTEDHESSPVQAAVAGGGGPVLRIELINTSVYRTIVSAIQATAKIFKFLTTNLFNHVKEPVDSTWVGPDIDIRSNSMYAQAEEHILNLIKQYDDKAIRRRSGLYHGHTSLKTLKKKRLFITGHSLGGALSTSKNTPLNDYICY